MNDFAFSDLGRVHWSSTLKLTAARGFCAGLVWAILMSFGPSAPSTSTILAGPFIWAVLALPVALLMQLVGMLFGAVSGALGAWFTFIGSLMICIGDPIVYFVNRAYPALLNIADLRFFNFRPMIFITYPD